ncbi:type IV secretion protein Rhs, partial [Streptomyces sp. SID14478]|uniref:restriction endonuclease fold toxin n=1 Tax=Streptomyces sp. SID14478 TaxID=2706073 RepID=UPI0013DE7D28
EEAADAANAARRAERLGDDAEGAGRRADDPHDPSRPPNCKCSGREPVDFATGRMFLPQVDVELPGTLPLLLRRDFESSYRAGRWFGPTWSSTIDQRLEVDAIGVVFHGEDNLLLPYPHPAPGAPVLPEAGPGRPLERHPDGSYTLADPETGLTYTFDAPDGAEPGGDGTALLASVTDRAGHTVTAEYDADGAPLALVHHGGYRLEFTVDDGRVTALGLAGSGTGPLLRYGYDDGHLTSLTDSEGRVTRFTYDDEGRVTSWTDTNGSRFTFGYDDQDRCVTQTGVEGHLRSDFHYSAPDPATGLTTTTVTDSLGHTWRYLVNERLQVVAEKDPTGATVRTARDRRGRVLSRTDALGGRTLFAYDAEGRLVSVTRPDASVQRAAYDPQGRLVELTLPGGARWRQEFDERGLRRGVTDPAGRTTHYTHDEHGHLATVTDPLGAVTRLRHDAAGLLLERTDPTGGTSRRRRDPFGRIVELTGARGDVTAFAWTPEGRLARRTGPDGATESWTYDGEGNCLTHTDPAGRTTRFAYTHFDLIAARTDPDGSRHTFTHDTELRLTQVTNPQGLQWSYTYDAAGRLVEESDFDGRATRYDNDPLGHVAARHTPLGTTVRYGRDAMGRVVRKDAQGALTTYEYDPAGRLVHAQGPDADLTYQYDRCGRVKTELTDGRALSFTYDAAGRRTRRVTPSGQVTTYAYDGAGRTERLDVAGRAIAFTYDPAGEELTRRLGEALTLTTQRDATGRITGRDLTHGGRSVHRRGYAYTADGQVAAERDSLRGPRGYTLDDAGRVTAVTAERWQETYAYQGAGSAPADARWPERHPGGDAAGARDYQGTRLLTAGANRYAYDDGGRLVRRTRKRLSRGPDTWTYTYDAEDRLAQVRTPDGTSWRYRYDPLGRRVAKERLGADGTDVVERTEFVWDGPVLAEQSTAPHGELPHRTTLTWDYDGLTPLTQTERLTDDATRAEIDSRFFALTTDLIGTPTELVDEQGRIAWQSRATLWGVTAWKADADAYTPLRFPGQYFDPESGLHYNHHRYYDPLTARYTTPDPLGLDPAPDPAGYVHNPCTTSDPLGLAPYENNGGLGELQKVPKPDPAADKLAEKLGGESRMKFENDPSGREFDAISDDYVAQTKPEGMQMGSAFRNQAKATFERAIESGRTPYFHFEGQPTAEVVSKLQDYGRRYGLDPVIDISPL